MPHVIQIHPADNVAVALRPLRQGEAPLPQDAGFTLRQDIPQGHKLALGSIAAGAPVVKYGCPIGLARQNIAAGEWVHTHNTATALTQSGEYRYQPDYTPLPPQPARRFMGYLRPNGQAGVRNALWVLPTVGCVNEVCTRLVQQNSHLAGAFGLDGIHAFTHPYGCSQLGEDHEATRQILAGLARHPNAGGVLVVGLGCENNTMDSFRRLLGDVDDDRIRFMVCQQEADELETGSRLLRELAEYAGAFRREPLPASMLAVGLKCGGSDGLSGVTANPLVGAFSDRLVAMGGSSILTEVPEMFGAEDVLLRRCVSQEVFGRAVSMVQDFKQYFTSHHQPVYENPSPGNKDGGITTLEDKSLGCVQKGGSAPVVDVLAYGGRLRVPGLSLLSGPGNDLVSATALTAAGAQMILFTTGRGTPFGAPAPTLKIASNTPLAKSKANWMDFDAGVIAAGQSIDETAGSLLDLVLEVAGGRQARNEVNGYQSIAIFKNGITL